LNTIVIIPAYNEEGKISQVVQGIKNCNHGLITEILVVDDASTDRTSTEARAAGATVISHRNNHGAGAAIRTGIIYAMKKGYDACVLMGGDDQDDPSEIDRLFEPIIKDGYDLVQGSRYLNQQRTINMPPFRYITTKMYTTFFRLVSRFPVTDASNGFRALRLSIFKRIDIWQENLGRYDLEPFLFLQAIKNGLRVKEVPVTKKFDLEKGYSKMKPVVSWYSICKPLLKELYWNGRKKAVQTRKLPANERIR